MPNQHDNLFLEGEWTCHQTTLEDLAKKEFDSADTICYLDFSLPRFREFVQRVVED